MFRSLPGLFKFFVFSIIESGADRMLAQSCGACKKKSELGGWLRNRLRYCIWHHWKKSERKRKNLIRLGVDPGQAYAWSRSRMGGWAIAQSPILGTTITIERLVKRGYEALTTWYIKVAPKYKSSPLFGC
jgi:hypothetical protein